MIACVLTVSDKASVGKREDTSGAAIVFYLEKMGARVAGVEIVPDEVDRIASRLVHFADERGANLILTTGGTGLSPRDVTPEATMRVIDREIPGIPETMRAESLKKTPHAMISRAVAGMRGETIIINLPGSPKAVIECLEIIAPALPHAVKKAGGDPEDCAR
ncbi:MAG: MogA/MoaB family molybdenum cofactor biosynthesis protein [Deltaproteobacteria bacterium]|nr:MogA/MoaB family molybdenum cofactor biosynthesis protein [Candidatus Zymogenaceae bacterium]